MNTMRLFGMIAIAVATAPLCAPADMPRGLFHGQMVSWEGSADQGHSAGTQHRGHRRRLRIRLPEHCRAFPPAHHRGEARTRRSPRDHHRSQARLAGLLHPHAACDSAGSSSESREARAATRPTFDLPHGDRTISGVIIRRDARSLTLRTRDGEQTLLLRKDTRYLGDGAQQDAAAALVNTRVFVRAGPNLYGGIEAYQVMWGEIVGVQ